MIKKICAVFAIFFIGNIVAKDKQQDIFKFKPFVQMSNQHYKSTEKSYAQTIIHTDLYGRVYLEQKYPYYKTIGLKSKEIGLECQARVNDYVRFISKLSLCQIRNANQEFKSEKSTMSAKYTFGLRNIIYNDEKCKIYAEIEKSYMRMTPKNRSYESDESDAPMIIEGINAKVVACRKLNKLA